jgi:hypothetical protein
MTRKTTRRSAGIIALDGETLADVERRIAAAERADSVPRVDAADLVRLDGIADVMHRATLPGRLATRDRQLMIDHIRSTYADLDTTRWDVASDVYVSERFKILRERQRDDAREAALVADTSTENSARARMTKRSRTAWKGGN